MSICNFAENEGKMNTQVEGGSIQDTYSEVYDWRPSVEKTDVMRTMEAIEGYSFCHTVAIFINSTKFLFNYENTV